MRFSKACVTGLTAALMGFASIPAQADVMTSDFSLLFRGNCTDCAAAAGTDTFAVSGKLTLKAGEYFYSQKVGPDSFVSFTYNGSNLIDAFTIVAAENVSFFTPYGSNAFMIIEDFGFDKFRYFESDIEGNWATGIQYPAAADMGNGATLTLENAVPEPATLLLLGAALTGLGLSRRRRQI